MPGRTIPIQAKSQKRFPDAAEGRAWIRYTCDSAISFQPLESRKDGTWRPARVTNISAKGLGLVLDVPAQRGAIFCVILEGPANRFSQPVLVRVVRAKEQSGGGWHVGCTFAIPLDEDELLALLPPGNPLQAAAEQRRQAPAPQELRLAAATHDPFLQGSVNERRTFPRRRISAPVLIACGSAGEATHEAHAIDTSLGGLRLLTRRPFGRGTMLRVRSTKAPARVPSVEVRVKSCNPQQSKWVIATQFLHQPTAEILFYFS